MLPPYDVCLKILQFSEGPSHIINWNVKKMRKRCFRFLAKNPELMPYLKEMQIPIRVQWKNEFGRFMLRKFVQYGSLTPIEIEDLKKSIFRYREVSRVKYIKTTTQSREDVLMEYVVRRDPKALRDLSDLYRPQVARFARNFLRGMRAQINVDDIVQLVFLVVWNSAWRYAKKGTFKAWLFSIAKFRLLKELAEQRKLPVTISLDAPPGGWDTGCLYDVLGDELAQDAWSDG